MSATQKNHILKKNLNMNKNTITDELKKQLKRLRPWVMIMMILSFLVTFITGSLTVFNLLGSSFISNFTKNIGGNIGGFTKESIYLLLATSLLLLISIKLLRFWKSIKNVLDNGGINHLEKAMRAQADLWKIISVYSIITFVIALVPIVFFMVIVR